MITKWKLNFKIIERNICLLLEIRKTVIIICPFCNMKRKERSDLEYDISFDWPRKFQFETNQH